MYRLKKTLFVDRKSCFSPFQGKKEKSGKYSFSFLRETEAEARILSIFFLLHLYCSLPLRLIRYCCTQ